jgi:hypothetical protein
MASFEPQPWLFTTARNRWLLSIANTKASSMPGVPYPRMVRVVVAKNPTRTQAVTVTAVVGKGKDRAGGGRAWWVHVGPMTHTAQKSVNGHTHAHAPRAHMHMHIHKGGGGRESGGDGLPVGRPLSGNKGWQHASNATRLCTAHLQWPCPTGLVSTVVHMLPRSHGQERRPAAPAEGGCGRPSAFLFLFPFLLEFSIF